MEPKPIYKPQSARCVLIRISVTPEEKELIQSSLSTRERAEILLYAITMRDDINQEVKQFLAEN